MTRQERNALEQELVAIIRCIDADAERAKAPFLEQLCRLRALDAPDVFHATIDTEAKAIGAGTL